MRSTGQVPPEQFTKTEAALKALAAADFPVEQFWRLHHNAAWGKTTSLGAHAVWARDHSEARGENVATRRRISRVLALRRASPSSDWIELIGQPWKDEPLAEDTNDKAPRAAPRVAWPPPTP